jgi:hypothetical protein
MEGEAGECRPCACQGEEKLIVASLSHGLRRRASRWISPKVAVAASITRHSDSEGASGDSRSRWPASAPALR